MLKFRVDLNFNGGRSTVDGGRRVTSVYRLPYTVYRDYRIKLISPDNGVCNAPSPRFQKMR